MPDNSTQVFYKKSNNNRTLFFALLCCALLYFNQGCLFLKGPNSDGSKMQEVELKSAKIPIPPGFSPIEDAGSTSTGNIASLSKYYKATVEYENVKKFYVVELSKQGWQFVGERKLLNWGSDKGERELEFRDGEYKIVISFAGETKKGWQYAIDISWHLGER